jgi:uncharacterized protein YqgV (UPF0045/DUF77 family)
MNGLVSRTVCDTKPVTVLHELTEYSQTLQDVLIAMEKWGQQHRKKIIQGGGAAASNHVEGEAACSKSQNVVCLSGVKTFVWDFLCGLACSMVYVPSKHYQDSQGFQSRYFPKPIVIGEKRKVLKTSSSIILVDMLDDPQQTHRAVSGVQFMETMQTSVEISLYPLHEDYEAVVLHFIHTLQSDTALTVEVNGMSTQVFGEYTYVMQQLTAALGAVFASQKAIAVMKIGKGHLRYTPQKPTQAQ